MKVAIIGTVGLPAIYGGWETLVDHLTKQLNDQFEMTVYCSSKRYDEQLELYNGVKLEYINLDANGVQSIFYDVVSIVKALKFADTLLILGVSGCVFLPFVKLFSRKRIIVNIDGMEWRRDKWGSFAKWFLKCSEAMAIRYADVSIADNKAIQNYISAEYDKPSHLIAYGADHVNQEKISQEVLAQYPFLKEQYAFKVCRIEPENNIHIILNAFESFKHIGLVVVGNWSNSQYGKYLKKKYNEYNHIHLLDPVYDQYVLNQLRSNCYLYVHGHSAGGTNPSLVEAMHLGLPIVAFDVKYNIETTHNKAKYFNTSQDLADILSNIESSELEAIRNDMRDIAEENYTWDKIAKQYASLFGGFNSEVQS
jgi:glycosyltransferase involved in cell wall biosynthesis